jgi:catechol 2,3-dioxygenase-like lactoylglutathione lyase family enzyme
MAGQIQENKWIQHHLHIRCRDIAVSRDFYVNVLGAEQLRHYRTDYGLEIILLSLAGTHLALSPYPGQAPPESEKSLGIYQLAFQVDNMEEALAELRARGGRLKGPITAPNAGVRAAFIEAPDGMEIELMEYQC